MTNTATVTFQRPRNRLRDRARTYKLELDGVVRDTITPGEEITVEVEPGRHQARARIDWTGSPAVDLDVESGGDVRLHVEPSGPPWMLWQVFGRTGWLLLSKVETGPQNGAG